MQLRLILLEDKPMRASLACVRRSSDLFDRIRHGPQARLRFRSLFGREFNIHSRAAGMLAREGLLIP